MANRNRLSIAVIVAALTLVVFSAVSVWAAAPPPAPAAQEETIVGVVVKTEKGFVIEAEDGDYVVKGKDMSSVVGKLIEVTGIITESDKGDTIEVKSFEEIRE